jgi:hypothetical protein
MNILVNCGCIYAILITLALKFPLKKSKGRAIPVRLRGSPFSRKSVHRWW